MKTNNTRTIEYRGHYIIVQEMYEGSDGKFSCWYGEPDGIENLSITANTLKEFMKIFINMVDNIESKEEANENN